MHSLFGTLTETPGADSAAVTRINPQPSSSQASESPSRHRSPTRFAPITYQSDLPPTHPGLQRPRTAPSQAVPIRSEPSSSSTATEPPPQGWFARNQQQERLWQGSTQQQAQQRSRAQQQQAQQSRALQHSHPMQSQPQSIPEISTPFASPARQSSSPPEEARPAQPSPDWHTSNSWHVSTSSLIVRMDVHACACVRRMTGMTPVMQWCQHSSSSGPCRSQAPVDPWTAFSWVLPPLLAATICTRFAHLSKHHNLSSHILMWCVNS